MKWSRKILTIGCALILAGCNDDSANSVTGGSVDTRVEYHVKAIDGYLQDAKVWLDITPDWVHDPDHEPSAVTTSDGSAVLDVTGIDGFSQYPLVVMAMAGKTIDSDNPNHPVTRGFILAAPAGQSDVTPLTTLVQLTLVLADSHLTPMTEEAARDHVAHSLGLPAKQIYGDFIMRTQEQSMPLDASPSVYAARNLVASQVFNIDEGALVQAVSEGRDISRFEDMVAAVSSKIRLRIEGGSLSDAIFRGDENITADQDNDTYPDIYDAFPADSSEWLDHDNDRIGNNADTDDDNDGYEDSRDLFPFNAQQAGDHDGDGYDSLVDRFPVDANEWFDRDNDNIGDNADEFDDHPLKWTNQPLHPCTEHDTYRDDINNNPLGRPSFHEFIQAAEQCGYYAVSEMMLNDGLIVHRVNSDGFLRQWQLMADGTARYLKNGYVDTHFNWEISEEGFIVLRAQEGMLVYMALLGANEKEISFKVYEQYQRVDETVSEIAYESYFFEKPLAYQLARCPFVDNSDNPDEADLTWAIEQCGGNALPNDEISVLADNATLMRINAVGETRAYQFGDSQKLAVFKRGDDRGSQDRIWYWDMTEKTLYLEDSVGGGNISTIRWIPLASMGAEKSIGEQVTWIQYERYLDESTQQYRSEMFSFVSREYLPGEVTICRDGDAQFDSNGKMLSDPERYVEFLVVADGCRVNNGERILAFTDEMVRGTQWSITFTLFDETELWTFHDNEAQSVETADGDIGIWSIEEGQLYVDDGHGDAMRMVVTQSDGKQFAFKSWWRSVENSASDSGHSADGRGVIESGIMWRYHSP